MPNDFKSQQNDRSFESKASPQDLDCASDLHAAIQHIETGTGKLAITLLSKYSTCHETHPTCPYRGQNCAIPDLLEGFFNNQPNSGQG